MRFTCVVPVSVSEEGMAAEMKTFSFKLQKNRVASSFAAAAHWQICAAARPDPVQGEILAMLHDARDDRPASTFPEPGSLNACQRPQNV
ncbi:hypothetical protein ACU4GD_08615 [Cupriavidus basilensis]